MRYLGGKSRLAPKLAAIIGDGHTILEPFCGGGAMTSALAKRFTQVLASDSHLDLIAMWQALQDGWRPPSEINKATYEALRIVSSSAFAPQRGFVGFGCSWGGRWFGGYAGAEQASRSKRSLERMLPLPNVDFSCHDYRDWQPREWMTVYCDPPCRSTTGYRPGDFDSDQFWEVARRWALGGATVYVSELIAPGGWEEVGAWARPGHQVVDKLFKMGSKVNG